MKAYIEDDVEEARRICDADDEVDALQDQVYEERIQAMIDQPSAIKTNTHVIWAAHNLERIADRCTNICERIIFKVTGRMEEINVSQVLSGADIGYLIDLQPSIGPALVVGGGRVAARKIRGLLAAGFEVTVVSPTLLAGLGELDIEYEQRKFELHDVDRHGIVFACTNDRSANEKIGNVARMAGKPVVVADRPGESTAFSTAVFRDGVLQIGVSTTASAPGVAAEVRDHVAQAVGTKFRERIESVRRERGREDD